MTIVYGDILPAILAGVKHSYHRMNYRSLGAALWSHRGNERSYLIGLRYRQEKKQGQRTDLTSGQNDQKLATAERIGRQLGISEKAVRRNEKFADGVDAIG